MFKPPDWLVKILIILIGISIWCWIGWLIYQFWIKNLPEMILERENDISGIVLIENNTLVGIINPVYITPRVYASLIDCIEWHESKGNENAIGKYQECGCLQFKKETFEQYCEGNIWDCEDQKECADKMLLNNFNNVYLWTTYKKCLK